MSRRETYYQNWFESAQERVDWWFNRSQSAKILELSEPTAGVYEVLYKNKSMEISAFIGASIDMRTAALACLKRLLGNYKYFSYWSGLDETLDEEWEIIINVLSYEKDPVKRERAKMKFILEKNPFLQDGSTFEYYPSKNARADLCIHPFHNQRRDAFLTRLASEKSRLNQPTA